MTALLGDATSWRPVVQYRVTALVDLRDPAVLREYRYGFGAAGADATVDITGLEAGYFGEAGLRDPHVVIYPDGTPLIRGNKLYFTATQAGLSFFQAAHWGVWTLDLDDPRRVEQVANLFFHRDGLVLGDHAGQIVVDDRDGGFHLAMSSWGDFDFKGVHVRYVRTHEDVLSGVHVLDSVRFPLPTDQSSWDPAMVRIDDRWYVGFVESPYQDPVKGFNFHPALARSAPGGKLTKLTRVGADLSRGQTEGIIIQKVGGRWYLLASDGDERQYRVYDLSMRLLGFLDAPLRHQHPAPADRADPPGRPDLLPADHLQRDAVLRKRAGLRHARRPHHHARGADREGLRVPAQPPPRRAGGGPGRRDGTDPGAGRPTLERATGPAGAARLLDPQAPPLVPVLDRQLGMLLEAVVARPHVRLHPRRLVAQHQVDARGRDGQGVSIAEAKGWTRSGQVGSNSQSALAQCLQKCR